MSHFLIIAGCLILQGLLLAPQLSAAARKMVYLDTGELVVGEVLAKSSESSLLINSGLLGEIKIPRDRVLRVEADPVPIKSKIVAEDKAVQKPKPPAPEAPVVKKSHSGKKPVQNDGILLPELPLEAGFWENLKNLRTPESWSGNFRVGMNLSTGDSKWEQTYLRGKLDIRPRGKPSLYRYTGSYTYQENERSNGDTFKAQDKYDVGLLYRYDFDNSLFLQNTASLRADQKKGIDREFSNLLGLGYTFRWFESLTLRAGGSVGVTEYESANAISRNGTETTLGVFEELVWKPLKRTSLVHRFNYYWNPDNRDQYNYISKTALRIRFSDLLGFEFSHNKSYDNDTGSGNNKDDTRWLNALIFYF